MRTKSFVLDACHPPVEKHTVLYVCTLSRDLCWSHKTMLGAGHYVVVCGYNADTDSFILQDPAAGCCNITVTSATFDSARKTWGTDEDLLVVPLDGRHVSATDIHKVQVYGRTSLCERCCRGTATPSQSSHQL